METRFTELLTQYHYRITTPRKHIFNALKTSHKPLSIVELCAQVAGSVDTVSVYRTIDLFTKLGIATAVTHGWKQRYELASPFRPHHHHLVCRQCGEATEIHSANIESLITTIAQDENFVPSDHIFEINGLCRKCQSVIKF